MSTMSYDINPHTDNNCNQETNMNYNHEPDHTAHDNTTFISDEGLSTRLSTRSEFISPKETVCLSTSDKLANDAIPIQGIATTKVPDPAEPADETESGSPYSRRIYTRKMLEKIEELLSARDHAVLQAIRKYRFLTSDQIGRLYITGCKTKSSATRQRNLLLKRLRGHGLIASLGQRIGGFKGGSSMPVWYLTEAGHRVLTLNDPGFAPRIRFYPPSQQHLRHTLAVAECAVQLTCLCRESEDLDLEQVDTEPPCWRAYEKDGKVNYLKPDLFVITNYDDYEDHWFVEIDLGTESMGVILNKCDQYLHYYYTGIEQKDTGVFPVVVWVVKDEVRKEKIKEAIRENIKDQPKMFLVITPDELEKMIRQFIPSKELC